MINSCEDDSGEGSIFNSVSSKVASIETEDAGQHGVLASDEIEIGKFTQSFDPLVLHRLIDDFNISVSPSDRQTAASPPRYDDKLVASVSTHEIGFWNPLVNIVLTMFHPLEQLSQLSITQPSFLFNTLLLLVLLMATKC